MDRTTVRLILLVIGILVIAGIYIWGRYKQQLLEADQGDGTGDSRRDEHAVHTQPAAAAEAAPSDADALHGGSRQDPIIAVQDFDETEFALFGERDEGGGDPILKPRMEPRMESRESGSGNAGVGAPFLIQLSVVAPRGEVFNGLDLRDTLLDLDLVHGEMGIFHRYDRSFREPQFSVASLVKPGTFPIEHMDSFRCPGVVLFFQPHKVSDPLSVFDDLAVTCHELAVRLGGTEWDENRQVLGPSKIRQLRTQLAEACETT